MILSVPIAYISSPLFSLNTAPTRSPIISRATSFISRPAPNSATRPTVLGADILDQTGLTSHDSSGELVYDATSFQLTADQSIYFDSLHYMNLYLKREYHAIHRVLWKSGFRGWSHKMAGMLALRVAFCGRSA